MAGFVIDPEDWKYSSAVDFSGRQRLMELKIQLVISIAQADPLALTGDNIK